MRAVVAILAYALTLSGCATADITVLTTKPDGDAGADRDATAPAAYCDVRGPGILFSTAASATPVCAGRMAESSFRFALCTCGELAATQPLTTDAFDGSHGPSSSSAPTIGGGIGTNGTLTMGAPISVGGSLWAGSPSQAFASSFAATIAGELHAASLVDLRGPSLTVDTDVWAAGGLAVSGNALIPGTLHIPQGAPLTVGGTKTIGAIAIEPVAIPLPCDCASGATVDVGGFVETYRRASDDALAGVDPQMLENVQAPLSATLPCGRLFFTKVGAHAPVRLTTSGRAALFIGGDFEADADFFVDVPQGSELDLFIEGNVVAAQGFGVGDPSNPARARVYIGGNGDLDVRTATSVAGNFYAPSAQLLVGPAGATFFGSVLVRQLGSANGPLTFHFDESVARAGASCGTPASCKSCRDCGNQACASGMCTTCSDSSQCCTPLVCRSGTCVLDVR